MANGQNTFEQIRRIAEEEASAGKSAKISPAAMQRLTLAGIADIYVSLENLRRWVYIAIIISLVALLFPELRNEIIKFVISLGL